MEEKNDDIKSILQNLDLNKALKFNRFFDFFIHTKKYQQLFLFFRNPFYDIKEENSIENKKYIWNKEILFALLISIIFTSVAIFIVIKDKNLIIDFSNLILPVLIGGMFTILGLSLAGLAIVTSTLGESFISTLIKENKLYSLISIIFNFYFSGFLIGTTIIVLVFALITLKVPLNFSFFFFLLLFFLSTFLFIFSTIYAIMLLGTCIRLFLVKYAIELSSKKKT